MTGVAETTVLPATSRVYHGSPAGDFTHAYLQAAGPSPTHYAHPPMPDSPAWFATNLLFSLHAAARFTAANTQCTITLHTYQVTKDIKLMSLQNMDDFKEFLVSLGEPRPTYNAKPQAIPLTRLAAESSLDGYVVLEDIVRKEPEYVLFDSGRKKLGKPEPFTIRLVPVPHSQPPRSRLVFDANPNGGDLATYDYSGGPGQLL